METKKQKTGINKPLICKKCGHNLGYLKMKPAIQELFNQRNKKETWAVIFGIALITQIVAQIISDLIFK